MFKMRTSGGRSYIWTVGKISSDHKSMVNDNSYVLASWDFWHISHITPQLPLVLESCKQTVLGPQILLHRSMQANIRSNLIVARTPLFIFKKTKQKKQKKKWNKLKKLVNIAQKCNRHNIRWQCLQYRTKQRC